MWPSNGLPNRLANPSKAEFGGRRWLISFLFIATASLAGFGLIHAAWHTTLSNQSLISIDHALHQQQQYNNVTTNSIVVVDNNDIKGAEITIDDHQHVALQQQEQHDTTTSSSNNDIKGAAITIDDHQHVALQQQEQHDTTTSSSNNVVDGRDNSGGVATNDDPNKMTTNSVVVDDNGGAINDNQNNVAANNVFNDATNDDQNRITNSVDDNGSAINDNQINMAANDVLMNNDNGGATNDDPNKITTNSVVVVDNGVASNVDQNSMAGNNAVNDANGGATKKQEESTNSDSSNGGATKNHEENESNSPIVVLNDVNGSIKDHEEILPDKPDKVPVIIPPPVQVQKLISKQPVGDAFKSEETEDVRLEKVLKKASMRDKTVIVTTTNSAWSTPGSILDLFLESFRHGKNTNKLLKHLVIIALDGDAYSRCKKIHPHCFALVSKEMDLSGEKIFMSPGYLTLVWRKLDVLRMILEKGYNFLFSDADIMWFRNPMLHFNPNIDLQVSCDKFNGNPSSLENLPNTGFKYVKSNNRTIAFYNYWYESRLNLPGHGQQGVFNVIKYEPRLKEIGVSIRFLSPSYYGGLCSPSKDLTKVCTMHVNCCIGLEAKVHDLKILLDDWKKFKSLPRKNAAKLQWSYSEIECLRGAAEQHT